MTDKDVMVKYGVAEDELIITKTAGRGKDKVSATETEKPTAINVSDKRVKPTWDENKEEK